MDDYLKGDYPLFERRIVGSAIKVQHQLKSPLVCGLFGSAIKVQHQPKSQSEQYHIIVEMWYVVPKQPCNII